MFVFPTVLLAEIDLETSQDQIDQVYTDETKPFLTGQQPVSREPIVEDFNKDEAPEEYVNEYGDFTSISELTAYLNTGVDPDSSYDKGVIKSFENVSAWKQIKNKEGKKTIFADTYVMDDSKNRCEDDADGLIESASEKRRINMIIKLMGLKLPIISDLVISKANDDIKITIINVEPVKAPLLGTMMEVGGFALSLKFSPYMNGYLVSGHTMTKLNKLEGNFDADIVSEIIVQFFGYVKKNIVKTL